MLWLFNAHASHGAGHCGVFSAIALCTYRGDSSLELGRIDAHVGLLGYDDGTGRLQSLGLIQWPVGKTIAFDRLTYCRRKRSIVLSIILSGKYVV